MNGSKSLNVCTRRAFRGHSGDLSGQRVHKVVEGGAGTNHRFMVVNHHVLDTLLGQTLLRITFGQAIWWPWGIMAVRARWGGGGAAADSQRFPEGRL